MPSVSANQLAAVLGRNRPTEQQRAIIEAPPGPMLVVAGAGAGKTETMASRAVWLVANGMATPEEILGLTFTRKAAQQLRHRIRSRLAALAATPLLNRLDPTGKRADAVADAQPTVLTYDSYAAQIIREYGLLLPVEPGTRIISTAELHAIASAVVKNYRGQLDDQRSTSSVISSLLDLHTEMNNHQVSAEEIIAETTPILDIAQQLPVNKKTGSTLNKTGAGWMETQKLRLQYLPLLQEFRAELHRLGVATFDEQMSLAARLVAHNDSVGVSQRARHRVVMLDEYQDTNHSQRVLLSSLYGHGQDPNLVVNAVGDPMQSIYGWRGASAANLKAFTTDFPQEINAASAPVKEMTESFRNPARVLDVANGIATDVLGSPNDPHRAVSPLTPFPGNGDGEVTVSFYRTIAEERAAIADFMAQHYHQAHTNGTRFTGAILVRANKASAPLALELSQREIPFEIVGLNGLLDIPEVADVIALATMLIRPEDNQAALRILGGAHVGLSVADLQCLAKRARNLAGRARQPRQVARATDALEKLAEIIAEAVPADDEQVVGLTDAVADLGEGAGISEQGRARVAELSAELRFLRTHSLSKPLPDLIADIEQVTGIRTETLARTDPHLDGAAGTVHLDRFLEEAAGYGSLPGASLAGFLDYLELAREKDRGLEPGVVTVRADRVQILTIHKAKGLEWENVALAHGDATSWQVKVSTFLTNVGELPTTVRGDVDTADGPAVFSPWEAENKTQFDAAGKAFIAEMREKASEENSRLFYVGLTRTEKNLLVTGSSEHELAQPREPHDLLSKARELAKRHAANDTGDTGYWYQPGTDDDPENTVPSSEEDSDEDAFFPPSSYTDNPTGLAQGAELVDRAIAELRADPTAGSAESVDDLDEVGRQWHADVTALIEEHRALMNPVVDVELSGELTATDLVGLRQDPAQFARRLRRPVPFKPNSYAKRGTRFHEWLEQRFGGATSLLDEDELPGNDEDAHSEAELAALKEAFEDGPFAQRTPRFVEQPFEVAVGPSVLRGRMDAIFEEAPGQWLIVDWKTGRMPRGEEMRAAEIQLAVYRLAFIELLKAKGKACDSVRAAFYYIPTKETFEPKNLPGADELALLIYSSTGQPSDAATPG